MKPGTVYMITGAAKGIGAAAAQYVVEKGGRVAVCDIDEKSCMPFAGVLARLQFRFPWM